MSTAKSNSKPQGARGLKHKSPGVKSRNIPTEERDEEIVYFDISELRRTLQSRWRHAAYRHRVAQALLELHTPADSLNNSLLSSSLRLNGRSTPRRGSDVSTGTNPVDKDSNPKMPSLLLQSIDDCINEIRDGLDENPWHDAMRFVCLDLPRTPTELLRWMDSLADETDSSETETKRILGHLPSAMRSHPDTTDFLSNIVLPFRSYVMACVIAQVFQQLAVNVSSSASLISSQSGSFRSGRRLSQSTIEATADNNLTPSSSIVTNPVPNRTTTAAHSSRNGSNHNIGENSSGLDSALASETIIPSGGLNDSSRPTNRGGAAGSSVTSPLIPSTSTASKPATKPAEPSTSAAGAEAFKAAADTTSYDLLFEELQNDLDILGVGDDHDEDDDQEGVHQTSKSKQNGHLQVARSNTEATSPNKRVRFESNNNDNEQSSKTSVGTVVEDRARSVSPLSALKVTSSFQANGGTNNTATSRDAHKPTQSFEAKALVSSVGYDGVAQAVGGKVAPPHRAPTRAQLHAAKHASSLAEVFLIDSMIPDHGTELIKYAHNQHEARQRGEQHQQSAGGSNSSSAYLRYHLNYFNSTEEWDDTKFIQIMMPLASKGLAHAEFDVGMCFASLKDTAESMAWLTRAANQGHSKALVVLAQMHLTAAFEADHQTGGGRGSIHGSAAALRRRGSSTSLRGGQSTSPMTAGDLALKAAAKLVSGRLTRGDSEAEEDDLTDKIVKSEGKRDHRRKKRNEKLVKRLESKGHDTDKKNAKLIAANYRKRKMKLNDLSEEATDALSEGSSSSADASSESSNSSGEHTSKKDKAMGSADPKRKDRKAKRKQKRAADLAGEATSDEDTNGMPTSQSSVIATIAESLDRRRKDEKGSIGTSFGRRGGFFSLGGGPLEDHLAPDDEGTFARLLRKTRKVLRRMSEGHALDDDDAIARRIGLVVKDKDGRRIDTNARRQKIDLKRRKTWGNRDAVIRAKTKYHLRKCFQIAKIALTSPDWDAESVRDRQRAEALLSMLEGDAMLALKEKAERDSKHHKQLLIGIAGTLAFLFIVFLCLVSYYLSGKMVKPTAFKISQSVNDAFVNPYTGYHNYPDVEAGVRRAGGGDSSVAAEPTHAVHKEDVFRYRKN